MTLDLRFRRNVNQTLKGMVTFRQVARSYASTLRAIDREQKRSAREAAQFYKDQQKQLNIASAADIVRRYTEYVTVLTSVHKKSTEKIDWLQLEGDPEPPQPKRLTTHEGEAVKKLQNFNPSFFDKILGTKKKVQRLQAAIQKAKEQDEQNFVAARESYEDWKTVQQIAKGVQAKDPQAYAEAIRYFEPFSDISELGCTVNFSFDPDSAEIELYVKDTEVIPGYTVTQTKTGKLSQKDLPKSKFNELYQDYICSCVLRVAREIFAYLPLKMVAIHAMAELVNSSTGHLERTTIFSAVLPPETIEKLNFDTLDPSDSMKNFVVNMEFSKLNGFSPVGKVSVV